MMVRKSALARKKTLLLPSQRVLHFLCLYCYLRSTEVCGRKSLSLSGGESYSPTQRSPLYESQRNVKGQHEHEFDTDSYLNTQKIENQFHSKQLPEVQLLRTYPEPNYVSKQRTGSGRLLKLYRVENVREADIGHSNQDLNDRKYSFAYAVRPTDGYTAVKDDFNLSHKESRAGKVTMGEYKVLLPDGRLQVVRYTADGKHGFMADVTYEKEKEQGAIENDIQRASKPKFKIDSQEQHIAPPAFKSRSFASTGIRTHPSLSPSLYYTPQSDSHPEVEHDHHHFNYHQPNTLQDNSNHQSYPQTHNYLSHARSTQPPLRHISSTFAPTPSYRISSPSPKQISKISIKPAYQHLKRAIVGGVVSDAQPTPKSIYDKLIQKHLTSYYAPVTWGQRAGPATTPPSQHYADPNSRPAPIKVTKHQFDTPRIINYNSIPPYRPQYSNSHEIIDPPQYAYAPETNANYHVQSTPSYNIQPTPSTVIVKGAAYATPQTTKHEKSRLVPLELFRAGPSLKPLVRNTQKEYYVDRNHFTGDEKHSQPENYVQSHFPQHQQPVLRTQGKGAEWHSGEAGSFGVKDFEHFETPIKGRRPNTAGVKQILDRLPYDNIPQTTAHPYELGSKDYGTNVGYSPTAPTNIGTYKTIRSNFKPSQQIPPEYLTQLYQGSEQVARVETPKQSQLNN